MWTTVSKQCILGLFFVIKLVILWSYFVIRLVIKIVDQLFTLCLSRAESIKKPSFQMPRLWTTVSKQTRMKMHKIMTLGTNQPTYLWNWRLKLSNCNWVFRHMNRNKNIEIWLKYGTCFQNYHFLYAFVSYEYPNHFFVHSYHRNKNIEICLKDHNQLSPPH